MDKKIKKMWLLDLRGGQYDQTRGELCQDGEEFCCLGVLCNIHSEAIGGGWDDTEYDWQYDGHCCQPSKAVMDWSGLGSEAIEDLVNMNDDKRWSFRRIATWIEKNL